MLKHLMVEIYNGCNFKCNMCTIWKNSGQNIDINKLNRFLNSTYCQGLESIGLTGGEPMLSNQLKNIAEMLNDYENIKDIYITSNGWFLKNLIEFLKNFKNKRISLTISIDGIEETHNKIRGRNSFQKALQTINEIKLSGLTFSLGVKMTIQRSNIDEIIDVYKLSKALNCSFALMPVVSTDAYFKNAGWVESLQINSGTQEGKIFYSILRKLQRDLNSPYIDMLCEIYTGKQRNMNKYGCLFHSKII